MPKTILVQLRICLKHDSCLKAGLLPKEMSSRFDIFHSDTVYRALPGIHGNFRVSLCFLTKQIIGFYFENYPA